MKFRGVEGSPQEIRDLLLNEGLQLSDYLEKPALPLSKRWLITPALLLAATLLALVLVPHPNTTVIILLFLFGMGAIVWLSIAVQIRFNSAWATAIAAIGGLLMLLVAAGYIAPKDTIDAIRDLKGN